MAKPLLLPACTPQSDAYLALQGRLLQTKKSGYFPSSSVKPCPVDARVSAEGEMELGAPSTVMGGAALVVPIAPLSLLLETLVLPLAFYRGQISNGWIHHPVVANAWSGWSQLHSQGWGWSDQIQAPFLLFGTVSEST